MSKKLTKSNKNLSELETKKSETLVETLVETQVDLTKSKVDNLVDQVFDQLDDNEEHFENEDDNHDLHDEDKLGKKSKANKKYDFENKTLAELLVELESDILKVHEIGTKTKLMLNQIKKAHNKEQKLVKNKNKNKNSQRTESGFNKKTDVPQHIINFINANCSNYNITEGQQQARTWVTKAIYSYIKDKNLYHKYMKDNAEKTDGKIIIPDPLLCDFFGIKEGDQIKFDSFQTLLSKAYKMNDAVHNNEDLKDQKNALELVQDTNNDEEEFLHEKKKEKNQKQPKTKSNNN